MSKLKDTEILTAQVYLNIEHENGDVDTLSLSTEQAIADYGELEVTTVGTPSYDTSVSDGSAVTNTTTRRKGKKATDTTTRTPGNTDVVLKEAE